MIAFSVMEWGFCPKISVIVPVSGGRNIHNNGNFVQNDCGHKSHHEVGIFYLINAEISS